MKKLAIAAVGALWAVPGLAHHDMTPLREAVMNGHTHAVGGATFWLAGAVVAMVVALFAVQKSVFRKR